MEPIDKTAALQVTESIGIGSSVVIIPDSGHMMHFDNTIAVCNLVKNAILGQNLPIEKDIIR